MQAAFSLRFGHGDRYRGGGGVAVFCDVGKYALGAKSHPGSHGIGDALMVSHGDKEQFGWQPSIRRSLMIDGDLVTISEAGVMLTEIGPELETLDWVAFPGW